MPYASISPIWTPRVEPTSQTREAEPPVALTLRDPCAALLAENRRIYQSASEAAAARLPGQVDRAGREPDFDRLYERFATCLPSGSGIWLFQIQDAAPTSALDDETRPFAGDRLGLVDARIALTHLDAAGKAQSSPLDGLTFAGPANPQTSRVERANCCTPSDPPDLAHVWMRRVSDYDADGEPELVLTGVLTDQSHSSHARKLLIAYVLRHRESVDLYLTERSKAASDVQTEVEARFPPDGLRARLLARRAEGQ